MNNIIKHLEETLTAFFKSEYPSVEIAKFVFQPTSRDHQGNLTLMVFPLAKICQQNPDSLANQIGEFLLKIDVVESTEVVKGFLNITFSSKAWNIILKGLNENKISHPQPRKIVLEYCGPNTNKPIHVGHLRNMFLGYATASILSEAGHDVHKVNIFNDRGIAICKSMIAYKLYANGDTPEKSNLKGDSFVGKYYLKYNEIHQAEATILIESGMTSEEADLKTNIFALAQDLLVQWEDGDTDTRALWQMMNDWFYTGARAAYKRLGIDTEKDYYESQEYLKGKEIVEIGYQSGVFKKEEDGAIYIDLTDKGLDKKFLQRGNGTSLYITQDMSLVKTRYDDYHMDQMIYVVGEEQIYHFKVLKYVMEAMNEPFSKDIMHLSYGLVKDVNGKKFASRDGTNAEVEMICNMVVEEAKIQTLNSGKGDSFTEDELDELTETIGLGALKFAILRVNAKKDVIFDPKEAVDLQGDTGAFIQYCLVRTNSLLAKWNQEILPVELTEYSEEEKNIIQHLSDYSISIQKAAANYDPSEMAQYALMTAKLYNRFYTQHYILNEENEQKRVFKVYLTSLVNQNLVKCLKLLGITAPKRM